MNKPLQAMAPPSPSEFSLNAFEALHELSFKLYSQSSDKKNIKLSEGLLCFIDSAIFDPFEHN